MKPSQVTRLNDYRLNHNLDVCCFPVNSTAAGKQYKFYIVKDGKTMWNPMLKDGTGKLVGVYLFDTFEQGLAEALYQARLILKGEQVQVGYSA